jgi:4-hydroxybenzoate polyprenyltransferase
MANVVPDSEYGGLVGRLPPRVRDLVQCARFDRPIGIWLLFWPCAWGVWLAGEGLQPTLIGWLLLGSAAMRGAGCVYNDIVDARLDARVARTASRPVASGRLSRADAIVWLATLCLGGLVVLLQLRWPAQLVALASLALVAAYPFMKRITWWPQLWLGLVFAWGLPVAWAQLQGGSWVVLAAMYAGTVCWIVGYDTVYAMQDREDDALVGVGSSALRLGQRVRLGVAACYGAAIALWTAAFWLYRADWVACLTLLPAALHLAAQIGRLDKEGTNALAIFRANRWAGALVAAACFVTGNA